MINFLSSNHSLGYINKNSIMETIRVDNNSSESEFHTGSPRDPVGIMDPRERRTPLSTDSDSKDLPAANASISSFDARRISLAAQRTSIGGRSSLSINGALRTLRTMPVIAVPDELDDEDVDIISYTDESDEDAAAPVPRLSVNLSKKDIVRINIIRLNERDANDTAGIKNDIDIRYFDDLHPKDGVRYFEPGENFGGAAKDLAVVIPFFNEDNTAVQQTLNSLYNAWTYLRAGSKKWKDKNLHVCLIQDGWYKAHESMQEYLKALFPKKISTDRGEVYWWEHFEEFGYKKDQQSKVKDKTFIFSKSGHGSTLFNPQPKFASESKHFKITLIVKMHNRRKHNSHEWFFGKNGFCDSINPEYLLLADAFTMYNNWCLYHLVRSLDTHSKMVAVTGRQRLMSKKQQGSNEGFFSLDKILRDVQLYDFESSNVIYNGAFSLGGLLPVIPGPCGLHRASNILNDRVRGYYFDMVNKDPDQTGLVMGNLRIAEDRILTYAVVFLSMIAGAYMEFNTLALFYFEAETRLDMLMFQRRRWINGSVAGYWHLIAQNFQNFASWKANPVRRFYIYLLLVAQFLTYVIVAFAPSFCMRILSNGIVYYLDYYKVPLALESWIINYIIGGICLAIYLWFIAVHFFWKKFEYVTMYGVLIISFLTSIFSVTTLLHYAFVDKQLTIFEITKSGNLILYLAVYVFVGPFIVSLLLSGKGHSFFFMLKSFLSYYLFLPMFIAWFGTYSYSRLWDLSWGNRPANEMDSVSQSKKRKMSIIFKVITGVIMVGIIVINIALFVCPVIIPLYIIGFFYLMSAVQLTLSIIYCIKKLVYKIAFTITKLKLWCGKKKEESKNVDNGKGKSKTTSGPPDCNV